LRQQQQQQHQQFRLAPKPSSTLHIYDLSVKVKNSHLEDFLRPYTGEYILQWIDEFNALAIFKQEHLMRKALGDLTGGLFKVKAYQDANPETDSGDGILVLSNHAPLRVPKTSKVAKDEVPLDYRQVVKAARLKPDERKPWDNRTSNPFGALTNEIGESELKFDEELNHSENEEKSEKAEKEEKSEKTEIIEDEPKDNWEDNNSDEE